MARRRRTGRRSRACRPWSRSRSRVAWSWRCRREGMESLQLEEIFWMRHCHMIGITAVAVDAERVGLHAHVLFAGEASLAFAAAEPGIDQRNVADLEIALVVGLGIRTERQDFADGLMTHGARQRQPPISERH